MYFRHNERVSSSLSSRARGLISSAAAVLVAASFLVATPANADVGVGGIAHAAASAPSADGASTGIVASADLSTFTPGNLISDSVFFNAGAFSGSQIDSFFRSKVRTCQTGYVCLKDYRQNTPNRPADAYCNGYSGAANESAATIIARVAASCRINPQVLIVMLEKEQSLVTHTWPSTWRFDKALGQGCPDTAPCDPAYAGFFYQIYGAARQMQIYAEGRWFTYYAPGKTWNILYHPNRACGSAPVYVQNTATAALYYYTPYQPNGAALSAGYGTGDGCSSYGNRNFFQLFSDWFGDPRKDPNAVSGVIADVWNANGGASGWIGAATSSMRNWTTDPGVSQQFSNADIFAKAGQPGYTVAGAVRSEYRLVGEVASGLRWPDSVQYAESGGAYQSFENGRIYQRPDGRAFAIGNPMYANYVTVRGTGGILGWPTGRAYPVTGGSTQKFDQGAMYQIGSGNNVVTLTKAWEEKYLSLGGPSGRLGFPKSNLETLASGTVRMLFSQGALYLAGSTWRVVADPLYAPFEAQGLDGGPLGMPTGDAQPLGAGTSQPFVGGTIISSASGAFAVTSFFSTWSQLGGHTAVGFPQGPTITQAAASSQAFTTMTLTSGAGGQQTVRGVIKRHYDSLGGAKSSLGTAIAAEKPLANGAGAVQDFDSGRIVCTANALVALPSSVVKVWDQLGGPTGRLGLPLGGPAMINGITQQRFVGGYVLTSRSGASFAVYGAILQQFVSSGGAAVLGAPIEPEKPGTDSVVQRFENGVVYVPFAGVSSAVLGPTLTEFERVGGSGTMGFATGPLAPVGTGQVQYFQYGSIGTSSAGTFAVRGAMRIVFASAGAYLGPLGFPVAAETPVGSGVVQRFERGSAYVTPTALTVTRGVLHREYINRGGPTGPLGWPVSNEVSADGGARQQFQNGTIYLSADGSVVVR